MTAPRIRPIDPPYAEEKKILFDQVMPEGMDPLTLFRTLGTSQRILARFFRAGILDRGPVAIRDREILIHRTTARCRSEYEWGVHVNAFARPLGLSEDVIQATVTADWDDPVWTPEQSALVRLCDELHDTSSVSPDLWNELQKHFDSDQILESIYIVGFYHTVSFFTNGLALEPEAFGERFPESRS